MDEFLVWLGAAAVLLLGLWWIDQANKPCACERGATASGTDYTVAPAPAAPPDPGDASSAPGGCAEGSYL